MRGTDGVRDFVLRLRPVFFGLLVVVAAAAQAAGVTVTPTSTGYYRMGTNAAGGTVWGTRTQFAALWESALGGAGSSFVTKTGAVSSTTVGALARKALRGGVYTAATGLAVGAIIDGAGWAISELKDQVTSPSTQGPLTGGVWCMDAGSFGNFTGVRCAQTPSAAAYPTAKNDGSALVGVVQQTPTYADAKYAPGFTIPVLFSPSAPAGAVNGNPGSEATPISDQQLGDEVRKSPEVVSALLTDPRTNTPVPTPELAAQADEVKRDIEQRIGETSDGDAIVSPNMDDDTISEGTESPWPGFCDWATVVCEWLEWSKRDDGDKEPLPETDVDLPADGWVSGVGEGSCPAPQQFDVNLGELGGGDGEFSWQPLCDTATMLRPVLITVAGLIACFILAGLRSTNTK